jgi:hypothetical protein
MPLTSPFAPSGSVSRPICSIFLSSSRPSERPRNDPQPDHAGLTITLDPPIPSTHPTETGRKGAWIPYPGRLPSPSRSTRRWPAWL